MLWRASVTYGHLCTRVPLGPPLPCGCNLVLKDITLDAARGTRAVDNPFSTAFANGESNHHDQSKFFRTFLILFNNHARHNYPDSRLWAGSVTWDFGTWILQNLVKITRFGRIWSESDGMLTIHRWLTIHLLKNYTVFLYYFGRNNRFAESEKNLVH